jgi:hypothetical protein
VPPISELAGNGEFRLSSVDEGTNHVGLGGAADAIEPNAEAALAEAHFGS